MTTSIPREFEQFVAQRIASGRFRSEEQALTEGLLLLRCREEKLDALRDELQAGLDDIAACRVAPLDVEDIKQRGRQRLCGHESADA